MKNKYQEVLNHISELAEYIRNESSIKPYKDKLQELVDKETPMKPIFSKELGVTTCGSCKKYLVSSNNWVLKYCSECGQKIDWSDEE